MITNTGMTTRIHTITNTSTSTHRRRSRTSRAPQPGGDQLAHRPIGLFGTREGARQGALPSAGRGRSGDPSDSDRQDSPARSRRARLDHRHRRRGVRDRMVPRRSHRQLAVERRRWDGAFGARAFSGAGAGNVRLLAGVPVYSSGVQSELVTPTGALLVTSYATVVRSGAGNDDRSRGLRRRRSRPPGHAQRAPRAGRRGRRSARTPSASSCCKARSTT